MHKVKSMQTKRQFATLPNETIRQIGASSNPSNSITVTQLVY